MSTRYDVGMGTAWLAAHWQERAASELRVASYSARLLTDAIAAPVPAAVVDMLARAPEDEVRHTNVCLEMARRHGGDAEWPGPVASDPLVLDKVSAEERTALALVSHGCLNETVANAWLERSLAVATDDRARAAIRELLADEIVHARTGWALLGSPEFRRFRAVVGAYLATMVRATLRVWMGPKKNLLPGGAHEHGVLSLAETRAVACDAIDTLVLAGFEEAGIRVGRARAALDRIRKEAA